MNRPPHSTSIVWCIWLGTVLVASSGWAETFTIDTPAGPVYIALSHVGPAGSLVQPDTPPAAAFRSPSIFSMPVPSGAGARALGLNGAFTAVADDATAASWNPAGLIQLERPELSIMVRGGWQASDYQSASPAYAVDSSQTAAFQPNYFSAAYPLFFFQRNLVVSLNYQEAYDFTRELSFRKTDAALPSREWASSAKVFSDIQVDQINDYDPVADVHSDITVTSYLNTYKASTLRQVIDAGLASSLDFNQQGIIDALSPALAIELTPALSFGMAFNYFHDSPLPHQQIRSTTKAAYQGDSQNHIVDAEARTTEATYTYAGTMDYPWPLPDVSFSGAGAYPAFSERQTNRRQLDLTTQGVYEEENRFMNLRGYNATFGFLWTLSRYVTLGGAVDLPWTANARQEKTIRQQTRSYNPAGKQVAQTDESATTTKDVTFDFPLAWAAGLVLRLNDRCYLSGDVGQTLWSDFAFQAEGEGKINPIDGSPVGEHRVADTWSAKAGVEYLLVFSKVEVPLRAGLGWEQRPALEAPDEYWSFSVGSGLAFGAEPGRWIFDWAYVLTTGHNVLGSLVPGQGLTADVVEQQVYVSMIKHF